MVKNEKVLSRLIGLMMALWFLTDVTKVHVLAVGGLFIVVCMGFNVIVWKRCLAEYPWNPTMVFCAGFSLGVTMLDTGAGGWLATEIFPIGAGRGPHGGFGRHSRGSDRHVRAPCNDFRALDHQLPADADRLRLRLFHPVGSFHGILSQSVSGNLDSLPLHGTMVSGRGHARQCRQHEGAGPIDNGEVRTGGVKMSRRSRGGPWSRWCRTVARGTHEATGMARAREDPSGAD